MYDRYQINQNGYAKRSQKNISANSCRQANMEPVSKESIIAFFKSAKQYSSASTEELLAKMRGGQLLDFAEALGIKESWIARHPKGITDEESSIRLYRDLVKTVSQEINTLITRSG